ncbi:hypothetical protein GCM10009742_07180 [Kribbella karoonensis]|uniref:Uncharacterized protein n=1 Tax=Kribbella karoonensis TaxID=324851 RepID=A0ABP4NUD0_9ACTN
MQQPNSRNAGEGNESQIHHARVHPLSSALWLSARFRVRDNTKLPDSDGDGLDPLCRSQIPRRRANEDVYSVV